MDWLESKYINIMSTRLDRFKRRNNTYQFRCPICGDSATSKSKARGFIFEKQGKSRFFCHNCGASMSVPYFIKTVDPVLYDEYKLEKIKNFQSPERTALTEFVEKMKPPVFMKSGPLKGLKKISQLSPDHPMKRFVVDRKIPNEYHAKLFCCPNFMHFTNNIVADKFSADALRNDEARLLIPFLGRDKSVDAYQGRSLKRQSQVKYITIVLNDEVPKLFGMDTVDLNKVVPVVEGPIDAMFIPNSVATAGGDLASAVRNLDKRNLTIVYDNEPRSKETVKKIDKAIMAGYSVCIWPENLEHKDINDMVLAGMSSAFIEHIIKNNTYRDLAAKLALTRWSKA